ncbi:MAG: hypothetical protein GW938_15525 [Leptospira sp.]|nr:hypothetical protein [Leptospira sp.]
MKILIILILLFGFSCSTLSVSEPASEAFSETLEQKARTIRSNPNSTLAEREAADDLTRAANLIRVTGRQSSKDQNEIKELREEKGRNDMLEWLVYIGIGLFVLYVLSLVFKGRISA